MEDRLTAVERELRLLREGFSKLAGEQRAEAARAEQRHREMGRALLEQSNVEAASIDRLVIALQEYNDGRGPGNGPATVRKLTPRSGKGKHGA